MNSGKNNIDTMEIYPTLRTKDIYLYGAGTSGRRIARHLHHYGVTVKAFIDDNPELIGRSFNGINIISLKDYLDMAKCSSKESAVYLSAQSSTNEIGERLTNLGLIREKDYFELSRINFEPSSICNLKCISCLRASSYFDRPPAQKANLFLSATNFTKVLDKFMADDFIIIDVLLCMTGEPTLNSELPQLIKICNERLLHCWISSNLNYKADFRAIIEAGPGRFNISTSGIGDFYELTHTGGKWSIFEKNLHEFCRLRNEINPDMPVSIAYHVYADNQGDDLAYYQDFVKEYNVHLDCVDAILCDFKSCQDYLSGKEIQPHAQATLPLLVEPIEKRMERAQKAKKYPCLRYLMIGVDTDLRVTRCNVGNTVPETQIVCENIFDKTMEEIRKIMLDMKSSSTCRTCNETLMRYYLDYNSVPSINPFYIPYN